jgi:hypothetical protein
MTNGEWHNVLLWVIFEFIIGVFVGFGLRGLL